MGSSAQSTLTLQPENPSGPQRPNSCVSQPSSSSPREMGGGGPQEQLPCPTELMPFGPRGLFSRRYYREGTRVAPYRGGCRRHQWNQREINEMALNMGKGFTRPVTRWSKAGRQTPPLSRPPQEVPLRPLPRRPSGRLVPARLDRTAQPGGPLGLRHSGEWYLLPARSSGMGPMRKLSPAVSRGCPGV